MYDSYILVMLIFVQLYEPYFSFDYFSLILNNSVA